MTKPALFRPSNTLTSNDRLMVALFLAAIIHIILLVGVSFTEPEPEEAVQNSRLIDVILVNQPAKQPPPPKAKFLANENQLGSGANTHKPTPPKKKLTSKETQKNQQGTEIEQEQSRPKVRQKLVVSSKAEKKVVAEKHHEVAHDEQLKPKLTAERLQEQIAQYGSEIREKEQAEDNSNVKSVSSVSARKYLAAQYEEDWERKVERMGKLNYPEYLAKNNLSAKVTMSVWIKADGSIQKMSIIRSSGYSQVDEATKRIVLMSAPFPPLPIELLKEVRVLEVRKTWKFMDKSGSQNQ